MTPVGRQMPCGIRSALQAALCAGALALLSACAATGPGGGYHSRSSGNYAPPGPPEDPWGPYIREASSRYRVPETWVRAVMRQESGGREYLNGQPITSNAGAMGLMQVMPSTYATLAEHYGLGSDPYDPHDNIMAGTAYLREMYDQFGSPGFLAAYNAGPGRVSSYLTSGNPLPSETVNYVASIAPRLGRGTPASGPLAAYAVDDGGERSFGAGGAGDDARSAAPVLMASSAPSNYANAGARSLAQEAAWQTGGQSATALPPAAPAMSPAQEAAWQTSPEQYGGSATSPPPAAPAPVVIASAEPANPLPSSAASLPPPIPIGMTRPPAPPPSSSNSFLIASAHAGELPPAMRYRPTLPVPPPPPGPGLLGTIPISRNGTPEPPMPPRVQLASAGPGAGRIYGAESGHWTIQVGAYATPSLAAAMTENARHLVPELQSARIVVGPVATSGGGTLYRARLTGLSPAAAASACGRLSASRMSCVALPPEERW